jgi:hypothetical protein
MSITSISFQETAKNLLKALPSRRMRDVIERRFGLKGGRRHTLEAIGKEYRVTRERVRQIEADALRHLGKFGADVAFAPAFQALESHLRNHGGIMAEEHLLNSLAEKRAHPHVRLLLDVGGAFHAVPETVQCRHRWTVDPVTVDRVEHIVAGTVRDLEARSKPVTKKELYDIVARNAKSVEGGVPERPVLEAYLAAHKNLHQNPYGEYGLNSWSAINPRGVRDKAYAALARVNKPMHFREVANAITGAGWSKRRAHPQTVHNELIKDNRFVLVGRGLYALKEWGYEAGTVKDVVISALKQAHRPLSKDEIISRVFEKRMVKAPTILLNLQNKSIFKRSDDGKYTLV